MLEKDFDGDKKKTASYAGVERCQYMGQSEGKNISFRRGQSWPFANYMMQLKTLNVLMKVGKLTFLS